MSKLWLSQDGWHECAIRDFYLKLILDAQKQHIFPVCLFYLLKSGKINTTSPDCVCVQVAMRIVMLGFDSQKKEIK